MLYAIICVDKPGALQTRLDNREAHLGHIEAAGGSIVQAGPFLDAQDRMCGSLLIMEADDVSAVETWAAADPYVKAGLFESVSIRPWKRVIG
ncbi:MAG: YciI family protein [Pseudomonadota bacterium]